MVADDVLEGRQKELEDLLVQIKKLTEEQLLSRKKSCRAEISEELDELLYRRKLLEAYINARTN